ncbi:MAG: DUF5591 domain-containing protein [Thermoplasmata archaeon]|nr:DUF5591 domain-containing protein [Thermoplasmata archaeon]
MLDVVARSQRARVCEYARSKDGPRLTTPAVLSSTSDGDTCIRAGPSGRVLRLLGAEVPLEEGLLTTAASGMGSEPRVVDGVEVVRLPFPEDLVIDGSAEVVVVPNAFELRHDARRLVDAVMRIREAAGFGRLLVMLGIAEPSTTALLALMGVDVVDDSLSRAAGLRGMRLVPEAEFAAGTDQSEANVRALEAEASLVSDFIRADRLRELADQRSASTPSGVAALRIYDRVGYAYAEETCSTVGCRFCSNTVQALRRPEVVRWREAIKTYRKPACKRILVLLPCSAKKPYHISKSHRAFASAIHTAQHDTLVHEVIVTSPLGAVPRELDMFFPANAYDIPVTGEWKPEEKAFIRELVADVIAQGYDKVICHLGEDYELVEGLAEMECTVVGDPTSPKSLENLDRALRAAAKDMEKVGYLQERNDYMRSVFAFQFGQEAADAIMDADTYAIGKFPYWKIIREKDGKKVQMGMMTPERGMVSLTLEGAEVVAGLGRNIVEIQDFEIRGNLFAVGVMSADPAIRIGDEAIFVCSGQVRGVGVAEMCGREMTELKRGIAVKVRHKLK